jgi:hypothetical protein
MAQGVRVELDAGSSTHWMESEEMEAIVAPLLTAAQRKLPTDLLISDETACAQRCAKAFLAVKVLLCCSSLLHPDQRWMSLLSDMQLHNQFFLLLMHQALPSLGGVQYQDRQLHAYGDPAEQ